jgi:hypothetical protein
MRIRYVWYSIVTAGLVLFSVSGVAQQGGSDPADTIFLNGKVLTVDTDEGDFTISQAVAVRDGIIQAVGSNARDTYDRRASVTR